MARQAIAEKMRVLQTMQRLLAKSVLTEGDAVAIGRQIKSRVWHKHRRAA